MSFKMRCPKCSSRDIEFPKLQHGYRDAEPTLHCRTCGKMLYGKEAIETEYRRQEALAVPEPVRPIAPVIAEIPGYREHLLHQFQKLLTEAQTLASTALGHKTRLNELRKALTGLAGDNPAALDLNRWGIDAGRIGWLVEELQREAGYLGTSPSTTAVQAMSKRVGDALARIQKEYAVLLERLPAVEAALVAEQVRLNAPVTRVEEVTPAPSPKNLPVVEEVVNTRCLWQDCQSETVDGRLYCCNEHRVKQARWNYRQRQLLGQPDRPQPTPKTNPPAPDPQRIPVQPSPQPSPQPGENQPNRIAQTCAMCGATVWKKPYQVKRNISGRFFCGHEHHQSWVVSQGGVGAPGFAD